MMNLVIGLLVALPAFAGNELGNGGDGIAQDFVATGRGMVAELRDNPDPRISDFTAFEKAVNTTHVNSTQETLALDGSEVDAINYPHEGRINFNRQRWATLNGEKRRALVLHEYLGICCDKSDGNYQISSSYSRNELPDTPRSHPFDAQIRSTVTTPYRGTDEMYGPSLGFAVGYEFTHRSTLGLGVDLHEFRHEESNTRDFSGRYTKLMEIGASYRYWLNDRRSFRPYVNADIGYARERTNWEWHSIANNGYNGSDQETAHMIYGRGGIGFAWRFSPLVALDVSANANGFYAFQHYDRAESIYFDTQLGLNIYL